MPRGKYRRSQNTVEATQPKRVGRPPKTKSGNTGGSYEGNERLLNTLLHTRNVLGSEQKLIGFINKVLRQMEKEWDDSFEEPKTFKVTSEVSPVDKVAVKQEPITPIPFIPTAHPGV